MTSIRGLLALALSAVLALAAAIPSQAAAKQLPAPKVLTASSSASDSIVVTFSTVAGAASYTVFLYAATGQNPQAFPAASPSGTTLDGLSTCTTYRVSVQANSSSPNVQSSVQSGKAAVTTKCNPALVPTFGTPAPTTDGFSVQITNYDAAYSWTGAVTAGSVTIDGSGLAAVTGLTTDATQTLTVTTRRTAYDSGSATVTGARSTTPVVPSRWIGAGDFTVELWVKPTVNWAPPARQELFAITPTNLTGRLDIGYTENGKWEVLGHPWSTPPVSALTDPPVVGTWTHVAVTRQSGTMRLYVAGQKVGESTANADFSGYNELILGADPNASWCHCYLAQALLSNVRVVNGTALYAGNTLTIPTSPLTAVGGTTFLLNSAIGDATVGSVELDGSMRYQQGITTVDSTSTLSPFSAHTWDGNSWQSASVITSVDSPFNVCGSDGLRVSGSLCQVGDVTAAGGTIFYASATAFTSTGTPCDTNCHYLEVAPVGWAPLSTIADNTNDNGQVIARSDPKVDPYLVWWARAWSNGPPEGTAAATGIGSGMSNTQELKTKALEIDPTHTLSAPAKFAFQAALEYAGAGATSTAGQWFLPSIGELNELCKYATGQTADLGASVGCQGSATGARVPVLGFLSEAVYWSSSYPYMEGSPYPYVGSPTPSLEQTPGYLLKKPYNIPSSYYSGYYSTYGNYVRPVRAS